jgi:hypothetical protein
MTKISNQYSLTNILTADLANSRLGINNVSPTVALDVTGAGKFSGVVTLNSNEPLILNRTNNTSTSNAIRFQTGGTTQWYVGSDYYLQSGTENFGFYNGSYKLTITSAGNVGIGTSSPAAKLDVVSSGRVFNFGTSATTTGNFYGALVYNGSDIALLGNGPSIVSGAAAIDFAISTGNASANMIFAMNNTERMRITSGGEVQIGTTTVYGCKLNVNGDIFQISGSGGIYSNNFGVLNGGVDLKFAYNSSNSVLFTVGGVVKGSLTGAGVWSTTGGGTSDLRKKQNIEYIQTNGIDSINLLKPAKFEFKSNPEKTRRGFIAQDVLQVIPNLVLGDGELEGGTYGLDYDGILALAVKAIQELSAENTSLINRIEALENK